MVPLSSDTRLSRGLGVKKTINMQYRILEIKATLLTATNKAK